MNHCILPWNQSFHGNHKKSHYFEGWYLKHQSEQGMISFIPAVHIDEAGHTTASIQIITEDNSYVVNYDGKDFFASKTRFYCRIGKSIFTSGGVYLDIKTSEISLCGKVKYGKLLSLTRDIMGPFRYLPFLQCNHGIVSLGHKITGSIKLDGEKLNMTQGIGYIEKDWGTSFPDSYVWSHCNWYENGICTIMLSIASIPIGGQSFTGCICSIYYGGEEYRLSTYQGVKIVKNTEEEIIVMQDRKLLQITILEQSLQPLQAPSKGKMSRMIYEGLACLVRYRFWNKDQLVFDKTSDQASLERQS